METKCYWGQLVEAFKGVVLILVGTAWAFLCLFIFTSITYSFYDTLDTRLALLFLMLLGVVPISFGMNRLVS